MASPKKKSAPAEKTNWLRILGAVGTVSLAAAVPFMTAHKVIDNALVYTFGMGYQYDVRGPRPSPADPARSRRTPARRRP